MATEENYPLEEDEEVVIEGSDLHALLSNMGYTDFECVPANRVEEREPSDRIRPPQASRSTCRQTLMDIYSLITRDGESSQEQIKIILEAEHLLDDHALFIRGFLKESQRTFRRKALEKLAAIAMTTSLAIALRRSLLPLVVALPAAATIAHFEYTRRRARGDLRRLVTSQGDFHRLGRRALKILRHGYGLKATANRAGRKFNDLEAEKLKHLRPMLETTLKSFERAARAHYRACAVISGVLPSAALWMDELATAFDHDEFSISGEITCEALKRLYYVYVLTQSDALRMLAIAYNCDTWSNSRDGIPETKLARVIRNLLTILEECRGKLARSVEAYASCKSGPLHRDCRISPASKWQDVYVHVDLTSRKLRTAYDELATILEAIDATAASRRGDEESRDEAALLETLTLRMNEAYKQIDTARSFAEFGSLLLAKLRNVESRQRARDEGDDDERSHADARPPVLAAATADSEPEIVDEVFEEYIKREYLKPIGEEADELARRNYKLEKLFARNFMAELKEALVDKRKSMAERESKALQRMYGSVRGASSVTANEADDSSGSEGSESSRRRRRVRLLRAASSGSDDDDEGNVWARKKGSRAGSSDNSDSPPRPPPLPPPAVLFPPPFEFPRGKDGEVFRSIVGDRKNILDMSEALYCGSGENSEDDFFVGVGGDADNEESAEGLGDVNK